jgi:hypothetical protein
MRKQIMENAAYEVATQVRAVEDTIDTALTEIAELQTRIMHVNSVAGVGFGTVHPTLQQLAAAVTGLVETRGAVVEWHNALADAKGKVPGLRTISWGDGDNKCPPATGSTNLRIVA